MLLSFTVGNFRSFKESKTFSMKAASIQEHKDFVRESNNTKLLPVAAVYGANSSGKSNLLSALKTMKNTLLSSIKTNPTEKLKTDTFIHQEQRRHRHLQGFPGRKGQGRGHCRKQAFPVTGSAAQRENLPSRHEMVRRFTSNVWCIRF